MLWWPSDGSSWPVRRSLSRSSLMAMVTVMIVVSAGGCGVVSRLLPGIPWLPSYVVNRDGHYYVGSRCQTSLTEVGVFLQDPWVPASHSANFDLAIWHAVASQGVPEFELFAADQPGVSVVADAGARPAASTELLVYINAGDGHGDATTVIPDILADGQVSSYAGMMTWDEFMKIPNSDFGCR